MNSIFPAAMSLEVEWKEPLRDAAIEVVELMAGIRLEPWTAPYGQSGGALVAVIGMGGALRGMTVVRCSTQTARNLGSRMLGGGDEVSDTMICDALGEVCNMIAGNFKSKIPGLADGCNLSVPTIITGADFCLGGICADNTIHSALELDGEPIWITLMVRS